MFKSTVIVSFAEIVPVFLPLTLTVTSPVASEGKLTVNVTSSFAVIFTAGLTTTFIEGVVLVIVIVADLVTLLWFSSGFVVTVNVYVATFNFGKVILSPDTVTAILVLFSSVNVAITSSVEFLVTALMTASDAYANSSSEISKLEFALLIVKLIFLRTDS